MKVKTILKQIERLISNGKTEQALEEMEKFLQETESPLIYDQLLISNQYYDLKKRNLLNLTSGNEEFSRIVNSLLEILKNIKKEFDVNADVLSIIEMRSLNPANASHAKSNQNSRGMQQKTAYVLATKSERFAGYLIESTIFYGVGFMLFLMLGGKVEEFFSDTPIDLATVLLGGVISGAFGMLFYPIFSGNLGHKIVGLKVICAETGKNQNQVLAGGTREFLKSTLGYIILPMIWLFFDENKQNLYDKFTQTLVVKRSGSRNN